MLKKGKTWIPFLVSCFLLNCASIGKTPDVKEKPLYQNFSEAMSKGAKIQWISYYPWFDLVIVVSYERSEERHYPPESLYLFKKIEDRKGWKLLYKEGIGGEVTGIYVGPTFWDINMDGKDDVVVYYLTDGHPPLHCIKIYNYAPEKETLEYLKFKYPKGGETDAVGGLGPVDIYDMEFDTVKEVVVTSRRSDIDVKVPSIFDDFDPEERYKLWQKQWKKEVYKWNGKEYLYHATIYPPE